MKHSHDKSTIDYIDSLFVKYHKHPKLLVSGSIETLKGVISDDELWTLENYENYGYQKFEFREDQNSVYIGDGFYFDLRV